jgi:hypothetical protein
LFLLSIPGRQVFHFCRILWIKFCDADLQGCHIFLGATYQNGEKYATSPQNILTCNKIYEMAVK